MKSEPRRQSNNNNTIWCDKMSLGAMKFYYVDIWLSTLGTRNVESEAPSLRSAQIRHSQAKHTEHILYTIISISDITVCLYVSCI